MPAIEVKELNDFLKQYPPCDELSESALSNFATNLKLAYYKKDTVLFHIGDTNKTLYQIRSGAVRLLDQEKNLVSKLAEGKYFGYLSVLAGTPVQLQAVCEEDCLLIECVDTHFDAFRKNHSIFEKYFTQAYGERIRLAASVHDSNPLSLETIGSKLSREPVAIDKTATIQEAARAMADNNVSALLILDMQELVGIVTDKDLRKRVVAQAMDISEPVSSIMSQKLITLDSEQSVASALVSMMQNNIHHLPVLKNSELYGVVTVNDIARYQARHPVFMVGDINKQKTLKELVAVSKRVPELFAHLVKMDAKASDVGRMMTSITDALTSRLIELAFEKFGHPKIKYVWLALGSQARNEQTAKTDQDNALVLANNASEEDRTYFLQVAEFVNLGLDACGYVLCPGDIMAGNPKWCQTLAQWQKCFSNWITVPEPKALMHVNIFFDLRCIYGDAELINELQNSVSSLASNHQVFLALMYKNSLGFQPPLGFFRKFVLEKNGEHKNTLDLKHHGLVPIIDLARIYILASGKSATHTLQRFEMLKTGANVNTGDINNLMDAFEFVSYLRIQHQGRQLQSGIKPDNHIKPSELSPLVRDQLRSAFEVVATAQKALGNQYAGI